MLTKTKERLGQRLDFLETTLSGHDEQLTNINGTLEEKLPYITEQFEELHQEMGLLNEKVNVKNVSAFDQRSVQERRVSSTPDQTTSSINNIIARLSSVQHDLDNLTMVTTNLTEEQDQRQMMIDTLSEQIEVLKVAKADKTNVEDILASKADMSQVHRKVSHDHFEIKIEGLSAKMDDAFNRLDVHEDMWQEEVELLKADIENKMDKTEFSPLKDYVNEKLKQIQDKMKILAAQRREGEAAGSKRKIIRDVQCISCDNKSVMKVENTLEDVTPPPPLPPSQSVKPFLTYKLDQVRKQQQKLPGKNLHHFEEMLHDTGNQLTKTSSNKSGGGEGHVVNRYVGGSHTTTTPQQRVTRTGNFYQTWGPIITAVSPPPPQQPAA
ncbi:uncharacterized protein LOC124355925 [Homalodisca vitripennis]|nr:uncharacterized protein LOC124355925 [Homalodisca vitripennis]